MCIRLRLLRAAASNPASNEQMRGSTPRSTKIIGGGCICSAAVRVIAISNIVFSDGMTKLAVKGESASWHALLAKDQISRCNAVKRDISALAAVGSPSLL